MLRITLTNRIVPLDFGNVFSITTTEWTGQMNDMKRLGFRTRILLLLGMTLIGIVLIAHCRWQISYPPLFSRVQAVMGEYRDFPKQIDPECQTATARAVRSDGERFTVITVFNDVDVTHSYPQCCIIDWENDRIKHIDGRLAHDEFTGWTVSHRYGIFSTSSHYGVIETVVFDTVQWEVIPEAGTQCGMPYAMSPCYAGATAISPVADQYLNNRGEIVDIPTGVRFLLPSKKGLSRYEVYRGTWSPDGIYLAYLVSEKNDVMAQSTLFLAQGDGSQVQEIADLPLPFRWDNTWWSWSPDGRQLVLSIGQNVNLQYVLDVATGRLHQEPSWH